MVELPLLRISASLEFANDPEVIQEIQEEGFAWGAELCTEGIGGNGLPEGVAEVPFGAELEVDADGGAPVGLGGREGVWG